MCRDTSKKMKKKDFEDGDDGEDDVIITEKNIFNDVTMKLTQKRVNAKEVLM